MDAITHTQEETFKSAGYTLTLNVITEGVVICRATRRDGTCEEVISASIHDGLSRLAHRLNLQLER